jgi:hypothetical protein
MAFYTKKHADGLVDKLTIPVLKAYCSQFGIKAPAGAKKADYVGLVVADLDKKKPQ